ncbi:MAG: alpha/beta fold hydrolase [Bacteroidetes bacterium]|nr:alpha/beta fold hydrolase [Bacteroidota bacterium]
MRNRILYLFIGLLLSHQAFSQAFKHPEGKFYKINGSNLWVELLGKGDPLFIISGGPGGAHSGMHNFDPMQDSATLVYIDNFGRGKSDTAKVVSEYSLARDVSDIEGLRIALHYDKINILGHSYGSIVAQQYAVDFPDRLKHLIIANGFFSGEMWQENDNNSNHEIKENYPEVWERLMKVRANGAHSSSKEHQKIYSEVPYGFLYAYNPEKFRTSLDPDYPNQLNTKLYYQMVGDDGDFIIGGDVGNFDVRTKLRDLKMPVFVAAGRYDRVSVPIFAVQYKKYCPQAKFVMFEHSGHNPQVEEPDAYFKLLRAFLRN